MAKRGGGGVEVVMHRRGLALYPVDPASEELSMKVTSERPVMANVYQPRNAKFSAMVHAVLWKVVQNSDDFDTVDELKKYLKVRSKMFSMYAGVNPYTGKPQTFMQLDSVALHAMDEIEFKGVWDKWLAIILTEVLPGIDPDVLLVHAARELSPARS